MEVNQVISMMEKIADDACENYLELFRESLNDLTQSTLTKSLVQHGGNGGQLRELHNAIPRSLQIGIDKEHQIIQKHLQRIQNKQTEIERLEAIKEKLTAEREISNEKIEKVKRRIGHIEEKHKDLENLKRCIKVYKSLTCTNFAYKKGSRVGYMKTPASLNYEVFDLSLSEINQQDVTEKLWALLNNISKEDTKNRAEYTIKNKKIILS